MSVCLCVSSGQDLTRRPPLCEEQSRPCDRERRRIAPKWDRAPISVSFWNYFLSYCVLSKPQIILNIWMTYECCIRYSATIHHNSDLKFPIIGTGSCAIHLCCIRIGILEDGD